MIPGCICHHYNHRAEQSCLPRGGVVVYHRRGRDPGDRERHLWPHAKTESRGCTSWLLPIPQTFPLHHTCRRDLPCQPVGAAHLRGGRGMLLGSENLPERWTDNLLFQQREPAGNSTSQAGWAEQPPGSHTTQDGNDQTQLWHFSPGCGPDPAFLPNSQAADDQEESSHLSYPYLSTHSS